jgi:hypothetical protein
MRGLAGYGRYDDAPQLVGCPRAHSDMTPCIARDGAICLAGDTPKANGVCVGCGANPRELLHQLDQETGGHLNRIVAGHPPSVRAAAAATALAARVLEVTEPQARR